MHINFTNETAKFKFIIGSFLIFAIIFFGCDFLKDQEKPDFVLRIPNSENYEYVTIHEWQEVIHDTISVTQWYSNIDGDVNLDRIEEIIYTDSGTYWIADLTHGMIYEFDNSGKYLREVFRRGRGPSEISSPASIYQYKENGKSEIYILDIGLNLVLKTDLNGQELNRFYFKEMPRAFSTNKLTVINENKFIWPTFQNDPVLAIRDSTGSILESLVERVIPIGYQPIMHNSVMYEIDKEKDYFAWSYHGVPLLMLNINDDKRIINLKPDEDPEKLNFTLEPVDLIVQPEAGSGTVYNLVREIFFDDESVWVAYRSTLIQLPFSQESPAYIYHFTDFNDTPLIYHDLFKTGDGIFFVRHHSENIYHLKLSRL
jgi:hypothetical protein